MSIRRRKTRNSQNLQDSKHLNSANNQAKKRVNIYSGNSLKSKLEVSSNSSTPSSEKVNNPNIKGVNRKVSPKNKPVKIKKQHSNKKGVELLKTNVIPFPLKNKRKDLPPEKDTSWEFFDSENLNSEESSSSLQEISNSRVVRREISEGHTLDDLTILERIKLGLKVRRKITNRDLIEQQKEELRRLEHEQMYYQTVKYFVQKETDILYTESDIQTVVIQVDRKFSEYLPKLKEDLSYLVFTEKPPTKDVLLAYGNIPHLFYVSLRKF